MYVRPQRLDLLPSFARGFFIGFIGMVIIMVIICFIAYETSRPPAKDPQYFSHTTILSMHRQINEKDMVVIYPKYKLTNSHRDELKRKGILCNERTKFNSDHKYLCYSV